MRNCTACLGMIVYYQYMKSTRYILAGAGLGLLIALATTAVILFQPGISVANNSGDDVAVRGVLFVTLGIGLPLCVFGGALLGWLWHVMMRGR